MHKLKDFIDYYSKVDLEGFKQLYNLPILLIEKQRLNKKEQEFRTIAVDSSLLMLSGRKIGQRPSTLSITVALNDSSKSQGFLISVGRSSNNSICLKNPSISKFHAYFKQDNFNNWEVVDASSSNGSKLNGEKLTTDKPYPLTSNDGISFGDVYLCTFFYPQDFYEYMKWLTN